MSPPRIPRTVSPATLRLLEEIEARRRRSLRAGPIPDLVQKLAETGEPRVSVYLREVVLDRRGPVRDAAAAAASTILERVSARDWVWLDDQMRGGYIPETALTYRRWWALRPHGLTTAAGKLTEAWPLLAMGGCHASGYVREAALHAAKRLCAVSTLPVVLLRLRDWVPQVRAAAAAAWTELLPHAGERDRLGLIPLIVHLRALHQTEELRAGLEEFERRLGEGDGKSAQAGLSEDDPVVRRYCFASLLGSRQVTPEFLFSRALADRDLLVQAWALTACLPVLPPAARADGLREAARSRGGRVRVRALHALWESEREAARDVYEDVLLDRSHAVRDVAIWALREIGSFDPAAYYRKRLDGCAGRTLAGVLIEMGRWGESSDVDGIRSHFASHHSPVVRAAALRAMYRLDPAAARPHFEAALLGASRRVARQSRDLLVADEDYPSCERAAGWARAAGHAHSGIYATSVVMRRCDKWKRLRLLLELIVAGDGPVADHARETVYRWLHEANRSFSAVDPDDAERIGALIERCAGRLPDDVRAELRFTLK